MEKTISNRVTLLDGTQAIISECTTFSDSRVYVTRLSDRPIESKVVKMDYDKFLIMLDNYEREMKYIDIDEHIESDDAAFIGLSLNGKNTSNKHKKDKQSIPSKGGAKTIN
jgi:hypothetical protein